MAVSLDNITPGAAPTDAAPAAPSAEAPIDPTTGEPSPEVGVDTKGGEDLPEEVLKIPAMNALLQGSPAAVYAPKDAKYPELKALNKYSKDLTKAGIGAILTPDDANVVVFNALYIDPTQIEEAAKNGTLDQVAVPYEQLRGEYDAIAKDGGGAASAPEGDAGPSNPPAGPGASGAPPAPAAQGRLTTARVKSLAPGSPTSGPLPGQGRILNQIVKPTV